MARRDTNFYYSFIVLPAAKRRAIIAVWDFCRAVDDAVDEKASGEDRTSSRAAAAAELAMWRRELAACFDGGPVLTPVAERLRPQIQAFHLPREQFDEVISGVEMDLDDRRYERFEDLEAYCRRVASAVGLICIEIFGYRDPGSREYALNLGLALQLTNILRDIGKDLDLGRIYLPLEDLARFGVSEEMLRARQVTAPVRRLLEFEAGRAHDYFRRAGDALPAMDSRRLVAARIMGAIYYEILRRVELSGFEVFGPIIRVPKWRKATIAAARWLDTMAGA